MVIHPIIAAALAPARPVSGTRLCGLEYGLLYRDHGGESSGRPIDEVSGRGGDRRLVALPPAKRRHLWDPWIFSSFCLRRALR